jgi:hypothetical protein
MSLVGRGGSDAFEEPLAQDERLREPQFGYKTSPQVKEVHMYYGIGLGTLIVIVVVLLLLF